MDLGTIIPFDEVSNIMLRNRVFMHVLSISSHASLLIAF